MSALSHADGDNSDMGGFICQALGIAFEAARLVAIQKLLHGLKMDPLVSLYWFAPVSLALSGGFKCSVPEISGLRRYQCLPCTILRGLGAT